MNENMYSLIHRVAAIGFFLTAITLFLMISRQSVATQTQFKDTYRTERSVETGHDTVQEPSLLGADILFMIYHDREWDMSVDGVFLSKDVSWNSFDLSTIPADSRYRMEQILNPDGTLSQLVYVKED